jgi:YegS/Rv2252/BmrU family lipid kinase
MDVILRRKPARVDTAELNGRRFLNVSSGGIGAEATAETPPDAKAELGSLAYALTGVRKLAELAPHAAAFEAPDFSLRCEVLLFAVANGRATGGGTRIAPRAAITDGLLDLCVIEAMPRADFARLALRLARGEHLGAPRVHYAQVPWVRVESDRPIAVNVDGEPAELRRLEYRARPGDLRLHVKHLPGEE